MVIIYILAFIALIAVIFGVSMHDAFWGIVAFVLLATLAAIIIFFLKMFGVRISNKVKYLQTPQGKKVVEKKKSQIKSELTTALVLLIIFSPILIEALFHTTTLKEFASNNELFVLILALAPVTVALVLFIIYVFKIINKKPHQK